MNEHVMSLPDGVKDFEFEVGDMTNFVMTQQAFKPGNYEAIVSDMNMVASSNGGKNLVVTVTGTCDGANCSMKDYIPLPIGDANSDETKKRLWKIQRFTRSVAGEATQKMAQGRKLSSAQFRGKKVYINITREWTNVKGEQKLYPRLNYIEQGDFQAAPGVNQGWVDPAKPLETPMAFGVSAQLPQTQVAVNQTTVAVASNAQAQAPTVPANSVQTVESLLNF